MNETSLQTALALRERGYAVHWLRPKSKVPIAAGWSTAPVMTADELSSSYQRGFNLGIRLGSWSQPQPGYGLVVLDLDVKHNDYACDPHETLYRWFDMDVFAVASGSRPSSQHWYFACPIADLPTKANATLAKSIHTLTIGDKTVPAWQIEVLSTKKQIVAPPSLHPDTGRPYRWMNDISMPLPMMPENILAAIKPEPAPESAVTPALNVTALERPPPGSTKKPAMIFAPPTKNHSRKSVADEFRSVSWRSILEPHGWQLVSDGGGRQEWRRPGKRDGISASTADGVFYVFTSSTPFQPDQGYSKFSCYAILNHGGDLSKAAKRLHALSHEGVQRG